MLHLKLIGSYINFYRSNNFVVFKIFFEVIVHTKNGWTLSDLVNLEALYKACHVGSTSDCGTT